jgi:hypothetical protein
VSPDLDRQYRLDAGGGAHCAHEAPRVADAFDVHEDALRLRVRNHVIEDFTEIEIDRRTERHDGRKAHAVALGPVEQRRADCAGLGNQSDAARNAR